MKIKQVMGLFKARKILHIYDTSDGGQWISNGRGVYNMDGMPHLTVETALTMFDVPDDKRGGWLTGQSEFPTDYIDIENNTSDETDIEPEALRLEWLNEIYCVFIDGTNVYAIYQEYIKPLLIDFNYLTFHKRKNSNGGFVLAVKVGMELKAIIMPNKIEEDKSFVESLKNIFNAYLTMITNDLGEKCITAFKSEKNAQTEIGEVDPTTGEIIN
ncbi:hypothetical protein FACS18949_11930 [Clostridia bacterium]|nr:hypothetical protein FACS18949_11930 [Clostridia bacterium]